jgi:hypothetical protein
MAKDVLLLYSPVSTPRLQYIASHMASRMLGIGLELITDREAAQRTGRPLVNYSPDAVKGAFNILPSGLLSEEGILPDRTRVENCDGLPVIFQSSPGGDISFDVFSASFYMLSRYEEYLPFKKDIHGRFPVSESLAGRHGLSGLPLVDIWAEELKKGLQKKFPRIVFPVREFRFVPTIDIDVPWAYLNRSFWRTAGGFARSLLGGDKGGVRSRARVLMKLEKDPFDVWPEIEEMHNGAGLSPLFFFPAGAYSRFDKSPPLTSPAYRQLIKDISGRYTAGIHPSYYSVSDGRLMSREIGLLREVLAKPVTCSRQHYLRLEIPATYRLLIENGITDDYTMGWAETPGFRAGTCTPFQFYDLEREQATSLQVWPFQVMDGTLRDYLDIDPARATEIALGIAGEVRRVRGTLVTLWHNESLTETGRWENWKKVYLDIISSAT